MNDDVLKFHKSKGKVVEIEIQSFFSPFRFLLLKWWIKCSCQ